MSKGHFIHLIFIILFLFSACKRAQTGRQIIKEISSPPQKNLQKVFQNQGVKKPEHISLEQDHYYYFLAYLYDQQFQWDQYTQYLMEKAIQNEHLFYDDAVRLYIKVLIKERKWDLLKKNLQSLLDHIKHPEQDFLFAYLRGESLLSLESIPGQYEFIPLVVAMLEKENQPGQAKILSLLFDFFMAIPQKSRLKHYAADLKKLAHLTDSLFLTLLHAHLSEDKKNLPLYFKKALLECQTIKQADFLIQRIMAKNGLRKAAYSDLKEVAHKKIIFQYHYALETAHYYGYQKSRPLINELLKHYHEKSAPNYRLRAKLLLLHHPLTENWIQKVIRFYNDYPNYYLSNVLLNLLLRSALFQKKMPLANQHLQQLNLARMQSNIKANYYYIMHLAQPGSDKWKNLIFKELPFSYAALVINQGLLKNSIGKQKQAALKQPLNQEEENLLDKVRALSAFNLIALINQIDFSQIESRAFKIQLFTIIEKRLIKNKDYKQALKYNNRIARLLFEQDWIGIDHHTLKKLYPLHYKKTILKYARKYQVDPAMAFAVMREESHFQKNIVSWAGAVGLMQIMPETGQWLANKTGQKTLSLTDPQQNIHFGVYYLDFLKRYSDQPGFILAAYNAGPGNLLKWQKYYRNFPQAIQYELFPFEETRNYIRKVMKSYYIYHYLLENEK